MRHICDIDRNDQIGGERAQVLHILSQNAEKLLIFIVVWVRQKLKEEGVHHHVWILILVLVEDYWQDLQHSVYHLVIEVSLIEKSLEAAGKIQLSSKHLQLLRQLLDPQEQITLPLH